MKRSVTDPSSVDSALIEGKHAALSGACCGTFESVWRLKGRERLQTRKDGGRWGRAEADLTPSMVLLQDGMDVSPFKHPAS